jgi:vacuolar-type H+-ATPase subunit I/STV1
METQKDTIRKAIEEIKLRGISKKEEIESLAAKKLQLESEVVAKKELEELKQINEKIESITDKVDYDRIQLEKEELYKLEEQIKSYESIVKSKNDFQEVTKQLREVMEDYDDTEEIIDAIKQYRTDYAQLVADTLNAKLDKVKIITFYTQKNGEIKETFEISMDGVPYSSLNTAGKVEAGIELIQLLSEALEVNLPILIDNKESVTRKFEVPNQVITMSVKEGCELDVQYIRAG